MKQRDILRLTVAAARGLVLLLAAGAVASQGATYYVDPATGDDANDGSTTARPLRTHAARTFHPGDTVLFKRGSVFRGVLHAHGGAEGAPITYGAYGDGRRPIFLGSVAVGSPDRWVEQRPSVWRYTGTLASEVCNLVFDD